jgi:hypothetical protein
LPGIIGERFCSVLDLSGDGYVDLKEFVHGFFKVYYSNLETKIKLAFDMYDWMGLICVGTTSIRTGLSRRKMCALYYPTFLLRKQSWEMFRAKADLPAKEVASKLD